MVSNSYIVLIREYLISMITHMNHNNLNVINS